MAVKGKGVTAAPKGASTPKPKARSAAAEPRPVGRPTDYEPTMCERIVRFGQEGYSFAEMASGLGVTRKTLDNWCAVHPEFLQAVQQAKEESLAWWEGQARKGLKTKEFNSGLWAKSMSGRFPAEPYRERVQLTGKEDGPVQHVDVSNLSDADLDRLEAVLGQRLGGGETGEGSTPG